MTTPLDVGKTRIMLSGRGGRDARGTRVESATTATGTGTGTGAVTAGTGTRAQVGSSASGLGGVGILPAAPAAPTASPPLPGPGPHPRTTHYPSSLAKTLGIIYREEGVLVLFSGVVPRVLWISLGGAVFLGVYEAAKQGLEGSRGGSRGVHWD